MRENKPENRLGTDNISKLLLQFSIPATAGMLVQALYNIINGFFMGQYVSVNALGATGLAAPLINILAAFSMLFGVGTSALISIRSGENRYDDAEKVLANGFWMLLFIGSLISLFGTLLVESVLNITGATAQTETFELAVEYGRIIVIGSVFHMIGLGLNHTIRARGNPVVAMCTMFIGVAANILLDILFVTVLGWGIRGAALATVIAQGVLSLWVVLYIKLSNADIRLNIKKHKFNAKVVWRIICIGSSAFVIQFAASIVTSLFNNNLALYGKYLLIGANISNTEEAGTNIVLAAYRIISNLSAFILMPAFGANQGSQPILGYNYGANRYNRVRGTYRLTICTVLIWICLCFVIAMAVPHLLIGLSVKTLDNYQHIAGFGAAALRITMISLPTVGMQIISASYFQAIGKPVKAMIIGMSRQVILLLPLIYIMPELFSHLFGESSAVYGLIWAGVIADVITAVITIFMIAAETKRLNNIHQ